MITVEIILQVMVSKRLFRGAPELGISFTNGVAGLIETMPVPTSAANKNRSQAGVRSDVFGFAMSGAPPKQQYERVLRRPGEPPPVSPFSWDDLDGDTPKNG